MSVSTMLRWSSAGILAIPCWAASLGGYVREEIPLPPGEVMEISSIALMPEDQVAVTTRRGDLWICDGAYGEDLSQVRWHRFARDLHEPLGMFWKEGSLWLTQRPELTRITDTDGDGEADRFETICADWGLTGNYHEYAFGSPPDREGNVWIALCLTGSFTSDAPWRGWCVRVTPEGEMIPTCSGLRSPGGIGFNREGDAFYTDNQGTWNGSSSLKWLRPGSFQGNPVGNSWHRLAGWPAPPEPKDPSRMVVERARFPDLVPPAVILPHGKVGQSPTAVVLDDTEGRFGPFAGQMLIGEQTHSQVQRVCLEKVGEWYQGAVFHFLEGFEAGIVPMRLAGDGSLFVGGTNRGWGSRGSKPFTFERVRWGGEVPFEMHHLSAIPEGFELTFTEPVDATSAGDPASYAMDAWTYVYQSEYGSPEVDAVAPTVRSVQVMEDGRTVRMVIDGRVRGHVHHLRADGVRSVTGEALVHPEAWYTLNEIPEG
ncbi:glucose/arabinose dehydrogenase [Haloferula luteola]|uniref:Glucose/arabinose dehydrogenase n=1 Tax=Haloferula luteola TaxID=595692 RepID=A0A840VBV2_9BACT|nr:hypothetical protein [Haloferula luteola]MBB5353024.1 glucose/arabinose dehydrogenase [Haloferula luteola]